MKSRICTAAFSKLGLDENMQRVVDAVHYTVPTPIQEQSILKQAFQPKANQADIIVE